MLRILLATVTLCISMQAVMAETVALELPPDLQFNCTAFDKAGDKHILSGRVNYLSATEARMTFAVNSARAKPESAAQFQSVNNERAAVYPDGRLYLETRAPVSDKYRTTYIHYDFHFAQRSRLINNGYVVIRKTIEPRPNVLVFHLHTATGLCDLKPDEKSK